MGGGGMSDPPDQARDVNHRLENRLRLLSAPFSLTVPMLLNDDESSSARRWCPRLQLTEGG